MNQTPMTTMQDDEIDLRELWATIVKRKMTILIVTAVAAIAAAAYVWTAKPVYSGSVTMEIGEVIINGEASNDKPTIIQAMENTGDLKEVISSAMGIGVDTPQGSNKIIKMTYEGTDKEAIRKKLEESSTFVLDRHEAKAAFYQQANAQIRPTALIGTISVTPDPIKPKKGLIVAIGLIAGLMMGIFLAFFLEFIQNGKRREE